MRLGQLARQLNIKTDQIVSLIAKEKNIAIKEHPNSKIDDELIPFIENHFNPIEAVVEEKPSAKKEDKKNDKVEIIIKKEEDLPPQHIETVKPAALTGPKIIGKIDLPDKSLINVEVDGVVYDQETLEAKKKESLKEARERKIAEKEAAQKEAEEKKEKARLKREAEEAKRLKLEAERIEKRLKEKAKQAEIKRKKEEEEKKELEKKRKEKQKEHYNKSYKPKTSSKKNKKTSTTETLTKEVKHTEEIKEKSLYKRFIKWLNT